MNKIIYYKDISQLALGERLAYLRNLSNCSQKELVDKINQINPDLVVNQSTISLFERGSVDIRVQVLDSICKVFDISADYFLTGVPTNKRPKVNDLKLTPQEMECINKLRRMSPECAQRFLGVGDFLIGLIDGDIEDNPVLKEVPIIGYTACGKPIEAVENYDETLETQEIKADFALIAEGNSMIPLIKNGDLILVHQQEQLENGDIGIFQINTTGFTTDEEITCKEYHYLEDEGIVVLKSLNPRVKDITVDVKNPYVSFNIIGKYLSTASL